MAQEILLVCDLCGSRTDVATMVVAHPHFKAWELDLCHGCYAAIYAAPLKSRPATRTAGKPQARFKITELPPQPD